MPSSWQKFQHRSNQSSRYGPEAVSIEAKPYAIPHAEPGAGVEFIAEDEYVEVMPDSPRLHKKTLQANKQVVPGGPRTQTPNGLRLSGMEHALRKI